MAIIPIGKRYLQTPHTMETEGRADVITSGANHVTMAVRGGYRLKGTIRPFEFNFLNDADLIEQLRVFIESEPQFEFPVFNHVANDATGVVSVRDATAVGVQSFQVDYSAGPSLKAGQFIRIGSKTKVYRVRSETNRVGNTSTLTLTHPLRQALTPGEQLTYSEPDDGVGDPLNGVLGTFLNENYLEPTGRTERGIVYRFSPIPVVEVI